MTIVRVTDLTQKAREILENLPVSSGATVIGLHGELGAGKTTFTKALAQTLGIKEVVVSPTFVIMKRYNTTHHRFSTLIHIDAYRLESEQELLALGFVDWCKDVDSLMVVEWPEKVAGTLPASTHHISFMVISEDERDMRVE